MKWKNRLTNYNFWISIVSAGLLILRAFDIKMDIANINEIVTAVLGLLVMIGIVNDPTHSVKDDKTEKVSKNSKQNEQVKETSPETETKEPSQQTELEETTPSNQQNENDFDVDENALQSVMSKIAKDLEQKLEELNAQNKAMQNAFVNNNALLQQQKVENILQNQPEKTPFAETDKLTESAKGNEIENNNHLEQGGVDEIGSTNAIDCQMLSKQTSIEEIVPPVQTESTIAPVEEVQPGLNTQPEKTEPTCFNIVN